ncbi:MAG: hypothetical protein ACT4NL_15465 [Pseudomarimonas sp.]
MSTFIHSAIRFFRSSKVASRQSELALLGQSDRTLRQEQQARGIETRLFFDTELLSSAQAYSSLTHGFKKTLLACGAGLLLVMSPMSGQAEDKVAAEPVAVEAGSTDDDTSLADEIGGWLAEAMGLMGDGDGDPGEGEGN